MLRRAAIYDPDVLAAVITELSGGAHRFVSIDCALFVYRERMGLTIEECAVVYELAYRDERFDKGGGAGPQYKGWLWRRKEFLRAARKTRPRLPFLKSRRFAIFVTRLHKAVRERREKALKEGKKFPSYTLIRVRKTRRGKVIGRTPLSLREGR